MKKAIVLGATGLTGRHLVNLLISDNSFDKIIVFTRTKLSVHHPKIEEHIVNLLDLSKVINVFHADVVFCCIGTTKSKTPVLQLYHQIDYGIPVQAAQIAKQNNIPKFIVVSALGANASSRIFYNKTKGQMQNDVLGFHLPETYILQPSLIIGKREEKRIGEKIAQVTMQLIDFVTPARYKMISSETIAKTMLFLAKNKWEKAIIPSDEIQLIAQL